MKKIVRYDQFLDILSDTLENWDGDPLVPEEELEGFAQTVWTQLGEED